jgi:disulfide bond formation protein DsbB
MSVTSLYFEWVLGLKPCSLCIMQRVCVFSLTLVFLCWCFARRERLVRVCVCLSLFFASSGLYFAGRQMYIQLSPNGQTISCGPDLNTLIEYFPWQDTVHALFYGSGGCGHDGWHFMGLSMATYAAMLFAFFIMALLGSLLLKAKQHKIGDVTSY